MDWFKSISYCFRVTLPSVLISVLAVPAVAQVQADSTLGSLVNNSATDVCAGVCDVTGGTVRGTNLFHSLQQFSLPSTSDTLDITRFMLNSAIENVIVRVTGGSVSNINGRIITINSTPAFQPANFFLLNPNGIVIGPFAEIFVGGSFLASTADRLLFPEGEFSTNPVTPPLLTVSTPIGLGFTGVPQPIRMDQSLLAYLNPNSLSALFSSFTLVGGDVVLDSARVSVPDARLELGGLRSPGTIGLTLNQGQVQLAFPGSAQRADVTISNLSGADFNPLLVVEGAGFGSIALHGRNISVSGDKNLAVKSLLLAGIESEQGARDRQAGKISINATDQVQIGSTFIGSNVNSRGIGNSGQIEVQGRSVTISNGSFLNVGQSGIGNAGNVLIRAQGPVLITGDSTVGSNLGTRNGSAAQGSAGEILVEGRTVSLVDNSQLQSTIFSQATGTGIGQITVRAEDAVSFVNTSGILTDVEPFAVGTASSIDIHGRSLIMDNGSGFSSTNAGQGNTGNIRVQADETIRLADSLISTNLGLLVRERQTQAGGELARGKIGNIQIIAPTVDLTNGSLITAAALSGTATQPGLVSIQAQNVLIQGRDRIGGIFTNVFEGAFGDSSTVQIDASHLTLNRANLTTNNAGIGNAGNIFLNIQDQLTLTNRTIVGSNIGVFAGSVRAEGTVGTIAVNAGNVVIDSSQIQAGFFPNATGNPGVVRLNVRDSVTLTNQSLGREVQSGIFTNVDEGGSGNGSDIEVTARQLSLLGYAILNAGNDGQGNAGKINLVIQDSLILDGDVRVSSRLGANAIGQGGTVNITTPFLSLNNTAEINVSSAGRGPAGDLNIFANTLNLNNGSSIQSNALQGDGGNIFLQGDRFLVMRRNSTIQTAAGLAGAGGNGGNILIEFPFVISAPNENNDIIANAFDGRGGQITINADNVYWFQTRSRDQLAQLLSTTDPRRLNPRRLQTNDITAFSQNNPSLSGQVVLNTPDVDPSRGLSSLPVNLVDPTQQISQTCRPSEAIAAQQNRFVITGRGGLPTSPEALLTDDQPLVNLVSLRPSSSNQVTVPYQEPSLNSLKTLEPSAREIIEAKSWLKDRNGTIYLVAHPDTITAHSQGFVTPVCASQ